MSDDEDTAPLLGSALERLNARTARSERLSHDKEVEAVDDGKVDEAVRKVRKNGFPVYITGNTIPIGNTYTAQEERARCYSAMKNRLCID